MSENLELGKEKPKTVRKPEPPGLDYSFDEGFRNRVAGYYNENDPEMFHSWAKAGSNDSVLMRKRQEAVKDHDGNIIMDPLGDFLVKQDRKRVDAQRRIENKMSLDAVKSTEGDEEKVFENDLERVRNLKLVPARPIEIGSKK